MLSYIFSIDKCSQIRKIVEWHTHYGTPSWMFTTEKRKAQLLLLLLFMVGLRVTETPLAWRIPWKKLLEPRVYPSHLDSFPSCGVNEYTAPSRDGLSSNKRRTTTTTNYQHIIPAFETIYLSRLSVITTLKNRLCRWLLRDTKC